MRRILKLFMVMVCILLSGPPVALAIDYSFTTIDFPGAVGTGARGINNAGQIAGEFAASDFSGHGYLLSGGSFTTIDFPGASSTLPYSIDNAGQVVGEYVVSGTHHGFLLSAGNFSTIDFPAAPETYIYGINDAGQIVGSYGIGGVYHGFLATPFPNTPTGSNVSVSLGSGTTATFSSVSSEGRTTVETSSTGPTPPSGFSLGDPPTYYDVSTTATFSGTITVCITYDPAQYVDPSGIRLLHFENNTWVDVTTSNNTANSVICGQVSSLSVFGIVERLIPVGIDIKPGSFPNSINLGSGGTIPVAILSTSSFDARTVDPTSVTLASAPVKLKGKGSLMASFQDVNGDGRLGLVVHVTTEALQLSTSDTEAVLKGKTFGGTAIKGRDSIRVVP